MKDGGFIGKCMNNAIFEGRGVRVVGSGHSNILENREKIPKSTSISVLIDQFSSKNWLIKDGGGL